MTKALPKTKEISLKYVVSYFAFLLIVWGFYRQLFQLPEEIEEGVIKPIIWLLPLFWVILQKEKNNLASLGITFKNFFPSIYLSLGLGAVFVMEAVLIHFFKYGSLNLSSTISSSGKPLLFALGLSFLTAVSEELAFRGYIFSRLANTLKSELVANTLSSGLWTIIHIPIAIFVLKLDVWSAFIYLALVMIFGVGASFVFARTKNIFSAIFLHVLWQWPLILFK